MKTNLLVFAILLTVSTTVIAQENNDQPETLDQDLGFNAVFIFQGLFQSQQAPFSVMYKKYTTDCKAIRMGMDISFSSYKNSGDANAYQDNTSGEIGLTIGVERQQSLGGKWIWYYGIDGVPTYSFYNSESYANNVKTGSYKSSSIGLGVKPLLGIRFNITPRLYVSAEASAALSYASSKNVQKNYNPEQTVRDLTTSIVSFDFNPASGIFLFYRF
jgi:hypothetical protein